MTDQTGIRNHTPWISRQVLYSLRRQEWNHLLNRYYFSHPVTFGTMAWSTPWNWQVNSYRSKEPGMIFEGKECYGQTAWFKCWRQIAQWVEHLTRDSGSLCSNLGLIHHYFSYLVNYNCKSSNLITVVPEKLHLMSMCILSKFSFYCCFQVLSEVLKMLTS